MTVSKTVSYIVTKAQDPSTPLPAAITSLLTEFVTAWQAWNDGQANPATPDPTLASDPVAKALERKLPDAARWDSILTRVGPANATAIRAKVAHESLALARTMGISSTDAVAITKGLIVATEPGRRR